MGRILNSRPGILIRLESAEGYEGFGESTPLPGLQSETAKQCKAELCTSGKSLLGQKIQPALAQLNGRFRQLFSGLKLSSASRFGLESALLNLILNAKQTRESRPSAPFPRLRINGLLNGSTQNILQNARMLLSRGYTVLKVKLGHRPVDEAIDLVNALCNLPLTNFKLRPDANRAWNMEQALRFAYNIPHGKIDYLEEPLQNPRQLETFYKQSALAYALDESLSEIPKDAAGLKAVILKPNFVGGFENTQSFIHQAFGQNIRIVLSDTFNSGLSLATIGRFAVQNLGPETAHGFDTYRFLKEDILRQPLQIKQGYFAVPLTAETTRQFNRPLLKEVACLKN